MNPSVSLKFCCIIIGMILQKKFQSIVCHLLKENLNYHFFVTSFRIIYSLLKVCPYAHFTHTKNMCCFDRIYFLSYFFFCNSTWWTAAVGQLTSFQQHCYIFCSRNVIFAQKSQLEQIDKYSYNPPIESKKLFQNSFILTKFFFINSITRSWLKLKKTKLNYVLISLSLESNYDVIISVSVSYFFLSFIGWSKACYAWLNQWKFSTTRWHQM